MKGLRVRHYLKGLLRTWSGGGDPDRHTTKGMTLARGSGRRGRCRTSSGGGGPSVGPSGCRVSRAPTSLLTPWERRCRTQDRRPKRPPQLEGAKSTDRSVTGRSPSTEPGVTRVDTLPIFKTYARVRQNGRECIRGRVQGRRRRVSRVVRDVPGWGRPGGRGTGRRQGRSVGKSEERKGP